MHGGLLDRLRSSGRSGHHAPRAPRASAERTTSAADESVDEGQADEQEDAVTVSEEIDLAIFVLLLVWATMDRLNIYLRKGKS